MKKPIAAIIAALLLASALISCGDDSKAVDTNANIEGQNGSVTAAAESTEPSRENTPDNLPSDLDFGEKTLNIIYYGIDDSHNYDAVGESGGDIVYDAVYNRNLSVEERLAVRLDWLRGKDNWDEYPAQIKTLMLAGSSDYDIVLMENSRLFQQSLEGYYKDLINAPYIDYEMPWWYSALMEEGAIDLSKRFYLSGDIAMTTMFGASAIYYNKEIFENYYGDNSVLYTSVKDGLWTHDRFMDYCRGVYTDLDGNSEPNDEDRFGFVYTQWGVPNYLSMSIGTGFITRDSEGLLVLDINNEISVKWVETLNKLLYTDNMSFDSTDAKYSMFRTSRALFSITMMSAANGLRDLEFEYGILPYPKLTENLDYMSGAATANGNGVAIPVSSLSDNYEASCAVIEALCAESYRKVVPAWYDTALKIKYISTDVDAQMVDLIYEHINSPFIMIADKAIGIGSIFTHIVFGKKGSADFASYWAKNEPKFQKSWDKMIDSYLSIG